MTIKLNTDIIAEEVFEVDGIALTPMGLEDHQLRINKIHSTTRFRSVETLPLYTREGLIFLEKIGQGCYSYYTFPPFLCLSMSN